MASTALDPHKEQPPEEVFPRQFGPFKLIGLLGRGGMGEVYVATREGIAGIQRRCVVKTLRPGFSDDREYVTRFLDEARVVVQLHHKNICPVYEVGKVGARHYLSMEYVAGRDLRQVAQRAVEIRQPLEPGLALHIICEVLDALDYAHRLRDATTDEPLLLVHRDVSPHNVMIGFEGDVRLIDFGLAASTLKVEETAPNVVMGKVAYMAPEQVCGEHIDGRTDEFAAAVTAYELIVGERFYETRSAREVYDLAARGTHRPLRFATLAPELRTILDRALQRERTARYDSCGALREAIDAYRFRTGLRGDAPAVRALMQRAFRAEIEVDKAMLARGSSSAPVLKPATDATATLENPPSAGPPKSDGGGSGSGSGSEPTMSTSRSASVTDAVTDAAAALDAGEQRDPHETLVVRRSAPAPAQRRRTRTVVVAAAAGLAVVATAVALTASLLPTSTSTSSASPTTTATTPVPVPAPVLVAAHVDPVDAVGGDAGVERVAAAPPRPHGRPSSGSATPTRTPPTTSPAPPTTTTSPAVAAQVVDSVARPRASALPGEKLSWLAAHCAADACAAPLLAHRSDWALLGDALPAFKLELTSCVSRCTPR